LVGARDARADLICLDLEDSTPPAVKPGARRTIAAFLAAGRPAALEVLVRVNALDTSWGFEDLQFVAQLGVDGVLLPKVEGDGVVRQAQHVLAEATTNPPDLWCLVETPLGVLRAEQIAATGIAGIVVGGAINAVLAAVGFNFSLLLRWFAILLRTFIQAIVAETQNIKIA
jgi:citrate lyase subunit beta/citryl-CoA lyase